MRECLGTCCADAFFGESVTPIASSTLAKRDGSTSWLGTERLVVLGADTNTSLFRRLFDSSGALTIRRSETVFYNAVTIDRVCSEIALLGRVSTTKVSTLLVALKCCHSHKFSLGFCVRGRLCDPQLSLFFYSC